MGKYVYTLAKESEIKQGQKFYKKSYLNNKDWVELYAPTLIEVLKYVNTREQARESMLIIKEQLLNFIERDELYIRSLATSTERNNSSKKQVEVW